ncbi:MAG TPA: glucose-6-phosphate dehydrogenase, partial [Phycisphaerae bacterium]|nr:glucose-6-phosphate dehydrogenase [Phycisphaerae bacterium]
PFGRDQASARQLNEAIYSGFDEEQVYRIDHYLGKETVQNMLVFRFANSIFEPLLNRHYVDNIQITTSETVGMAGRRGTYYDTAGVLRDMVQNHMLQMLSLLTMEPPVTLDGESIRDEKAKLLRSIRTVTPGDVAERVVLGQYGPDEKSVGYISETGVAAESKTETYAALKVYVDNWRWDGVPIYLRSGKKLPAKISEIIIEFKPEPVQLFYNSGCSMGGVNHLHIRIAPSEGIGLSFDAKVPGSAMLLRPVLMDFGYSSTFGSATAEAYEHLILDALTGDPTLFIRSDEVLASWRFIDSLRSSIEIAGIKPKQYAPGSWGPESRGIFGDPYKMWHELGD